MLTSSNYITYHCNRRLNNLACAYVSAYVYRDKELRKHRRRRWLWNQVA